MQYELAKKLKDAGFPHKCTDEAPHSCCDHCHYAHEGCNDLTGYLCDPPLEELIEMCSNDFFSIQKDSGVKEGIGWTACNSRFNEYYGFTPSEAVANLWLAINKK